MVSLVGAAIWSYFLTKNWFIPFNTDTVGWVSDFVPHFMAVIFQFGQNPAMWWILLIWNEAVEVADRRTDEIRIALSSTRNASKKFDQFMLLRDSEFKKALLPILLPVTIWLVLAFVDGVSNWFEVAAYGASGVKDTIYKMIAVSSVFYEEFAGFALVVLVATGRSLGLFNWSFSGFAKLLAPKMPQQASRPVYSSSQQAASPRQSTPSQSPYYTGSLRPAPKPRTDPQYQSGRPEPTYHPLRNNPLSEDAKDL